MRSQAHRGRSQTKKVKMLLILCFRRQTAGDLWAGCGHPGGDLDEADGDFHMPVTGATVWVAGAARAKCQAAKDLKREFKYYRLTAVGRKQLLAEESKWKQLTGAIARIMWPAGQG